MFIYIKKTCDKNVFTFKWLSLIIIIHFNLIKIYVFKKLQIMSYLISNKKKLW